MSIILKGIDKSKYARTFRIYPSGVVMEIKDGKIDNETPYEAIQIDRPHGCLIDGGELKSIKSIQSADFNSIETIQKWIDNAPTILEAEEE